MDDGFISQTGSWKLPALLFGGAIVGGALAFIASGSDWSFGGSDGDVEPEPSCCAPGPAPPARAARPAAPAAPAAARTPLPPLGDHDDAAASTSGRGGLDLQDEIVAEHLTRNVQFFGEEGQQCICDAFVIVVGLGGVGSHAAHMLLRSGVGRLRLIDFDQVTLSSLNRHAVATREDVGTPKATCLAKHFKRILPEANLECLVEMYTADKEEALLAGNPDFVVDAIDNIDTKVALVAACKRRGLPCLAVAGAGAKADPTRLKFVDVSESSVDPLARALRTKLRSGPGIPGGVPVLLSTEKPRCKLVSPLEGPAPGLGAQAAAAAGGRGGEGGLAGVGGTTLLDYQVVPNFRVRTIPVLGTTPALFGMAAAGYVLCRLAGQPFEGEPIIRLTAAQTVRQMERLREREWQRFGSEEGVSVDMDDIAYLLREVWRGFSARDAQRMVAPGGDKGLMRSTANLALTRWDASRPAVIDNLVLLTIEEADDHDALPSLEHLRVRALQGGGQQPDEGAEAEAAFVARVEATLDRVRREQFY